MRKTLFDPQMAQEHSVMMNLGFIWSRYLLGHYKRKRYNKKTFLQLKRHHRLFRGFNRALLKKVSPLQLLVLVEVCKGCGEEIAFIQELKAELMKQLQQAPSALFVTWRVDAGELRDVVEGVSDEEALVIFAGARLWWSFPLQLRQQHLNDMVAEVSLPPWVLDLIE